MVFLILFIISSNHFSKTLFYFTVGKCQAWMLHYSSNINWLRTKISNFVIFNQNKIPNKFKVIINCNCLKLELKSQHQTKEFLLRGGMKAYKL